MGDATQGHWPIEEIRGERQLLRRVDLSPSTAWQAPRTAAELRLASIWQEVLSIDAVGASDDFFELGGDLFAATTLAAEIETTFAVQFSPSDIINHSTISTQARLVGQSSLTPKLPPHVIVGRTEGSQPPVFMVHGRHGFAFFRPVFFNEVGHDRPIYLFQAPGLDGRTAPLGSIEEIAGLYVESLRAIQPKGPYYIVAMCAGSFIALEMCNRLQEAGQTVARLILLDPPPSPPKITEKGKTEKGWEEKRLKSRRKFRKRNIGDQDQFEQALRLRIQGKIQRQLDQVDGVSSEEHSYAAEAMLQVAEQLRGALGKYVPRPYSGKATVLITSKRVHGIIGESAFWRNHLGSLEHQVCGSKHNDLFGARLAETARFVRRSLMFES